MAECLKSCEICEIFPGIRFCIDCEQFFCESCEGSHLKTKPFRNHVFQNDDDATAAVKTSFCKLHEEKFTNFCDTCTLLICNICLSKTHKTHDFCLINDAAIKLRSSFSNEVQKAENTIRIAKDKIGHSQLILKNFENQADMAKKNIEEKVVVLENVFNDTKDKYLKSIDQHKTRQYQEKEQERMTLKNSTKHYEEVLKKTKSLIIGQNKTCLLISFNELSKTLKAIPEVSMKTVLPSNVQFNPSSTNPDAEKLIGNVNFIKPVV